VARLLRSTRAMSHERIASLRVLAFVARADTKVHAIEELALEALAQDETDFSYRQALHEEADLDSLLRQIVSPELKTRTLTEAIALANIDGRCSPQELTVLERIRDAFGAGPEVDLVADSALWRRRTARIRNALETATAAYLHSVRDDEHVDSSIGHYERHVAELSRAKQEIERAFREAIE